MSTNAWEEFLQLYTTIGLPHLRMGQFFVSRYIKYPWPELFYEREEWKASKTINKWLKDHNYMDELPQPVYRLEGDNGVPRKTRKKS